MNTHAAFPLLNNTLVRTFLTAVLVGQMQAGPALADESEALQPHFQAGLQYLKAGALQQARSELLAALIDRPSDPQIHFSLGVCYYRLEDLKAAKQAFSQALQHQPPAALAAQVRAGLGDIYLQELRTGEAIVQYDQAIAHNPRWPGVRLSRARAYYLLNNYAAALYDADLVLIQAPTLGEALELRGLIRWRQNALVGALTDVETAIAHQPGLGRESYSNLITLYRLNHLYPQAVAVSQKLIRIPTGRSDAYRELGDTYWQWYLYRESQVPTIWPMPLAQGPRDQMAAQMLQSAIDAYERAALLDPAARTMRRELGDLYRLAGRPLQAAGLYLQMLQQDPADWASLLTLSRAYLAAGRPSLARQVALEITLRFSREPAGWLNLAVVADRLEDPQLAIKALAQAQELAPDKPDILFYAALHRQRHGSTPDPETFWDRVIETHPGSFYATLAHGYKSLNRGDLELAEMYYQLAAKYDPRSSAVSYFGGEVAFAQEHNVDAIERFGRASALDDTDWHIYYRLGELYERQQEPDAARQVYRHLLDTNLKHRPAQTALLRVFERQMSSPR